MKIGKVFIFCSLSVKMFTRWPWQKNWFGKVHWEIDRKMDWKQVLSLSSNSLSDIQKDEIYEFLIASKKDSVEKKNFKKVFEVFQAILKYKGDMVNMRHKIFWSNAIKVCKLYDCLRWMTCSPSWKRYQQSRLLKLVIFLIRIWIKLGFHRLCLIYTDKTALLEELAHLKTTVEKLETEKSRYKIRIKEVRVSIECSNELE